MTTTDKTARTAGLLYLLVVLTGLFVLIYVPGKLFVPGDTARTAANILGHESLFRTYIVVGLVSELLFIALALALYRLLEEVDRAGAVAMVLLVLLDAPLAFLSQASLLATLAFLRGHEVLAVFDEPRREAIAMALLKAGDAGLPVSMMFWGLWLLPLGWLVFRSGFLPRFLGGWLVVNGIAYVGMSVTGILWPDHARAVSTIATPALLGEVAFALWLLVAGTRTTRPLPASQTA